MSKPGLIGRKDGGNPVPSGRETFVEGSVPWAKMNGRKHGNPSFRVCTIAFDKNFVLIVFFLSGPLDL